ncbi:hypothetical protein NE237_030286 [Protea cynaroides]|uniref:Uncharacterized protein n=1 Tax=Protea cynaroides TaxID=273540 RepID=A0A9Q0GXI9_9MAGN|nr:hypothetical protein NE237_030286 [Protea cynaroides]
MNLRYEYMVLLSEVAANPRKRGRETVAAAAATASIILLQHQREQLTNLGRKRQERQRQLHALREKPSHWKTCILRIYIRLRKITVGGKRVKIPYSTVGGKRVKIPYNYISHWDPTAMAEQSLIQVGLIGKGKPSTQKKKKRPFLCWGEL